MASQIPKATHRKYISWLTEFSPVLKVSSDSIWDALKQQAEEYGGRKRVQCFSAPAEHWPCGKGWGGIVLPNSLHFHLKPETQTSCKSYIFKSWQQISTILKHVSVRCNIFYIQCRGCQMRRWLFQKVRKCEYEFFSEQICKGPTKRRAYHMPVIPLTALHESSLWSLLHGAGILVFPLDRWGMHSKNTSSWVFKVRFELWSVWL